VSAIAKDSEDAGGKKEKFVANVPKFKAIILTADRFENMSLWDMLRYHLIWTPNYPV
jgi:hypothetical protein